MHVGTTIEFDLSLERTEQHTRGVSSSTDPDIDRGRWRWLRQAEQVLSPLPPSVDGRPLTTSEARDLGVTARMLNHPRFTSPHRGAWTLAGLEEPALSDHVAAAFKVLPPGTMATGVTGLQLHGVDIGSATPLWFCTTHPHPVRRPGLRVTRLAELPVGKAGLAGPAPCFVAAAEVLDLKSLTIAGDWLVRLNLVTPAGLRAAVRPGRRGAKTARRAAAYVRSRVDSVRESELRLLLVMAGLPDPEPNVHIRDGGRWVARGDLVWRRFRVLVEYDGLQHLTDRAQWERDVIRLEQLARAGWVVIRVTARRLRHPRALVQDVAAALASRGWDGLPSFGPEWTTFFAG